MFIVVYQLIIEVARKTQVKLHFNHIERRQEGQRRGRDNGSCVQVKFLLMNRTHLSELKLEIIPHSTGCQNLFLHAK